MNEKTLSDGTIVRFVNGYIDGNIYDHFGIEIIKSKKQFMKILFIFLLQ